MIVKKNTIYVLDEIDKSLVKLNFQESLDEVIVDKLPCSIVGEEILMIKDDANVEEKDSFISYPK